MVIVKNKTTGEFIGLADTIAEVVAIRRENRGTSLEFEIAGAVKQTPAKAFHARF